MYRLTLSFHKLHKTVCRQILLFHYHMVNEVKCLLNMCLLNIGFVSCAITYTSVCKCALLIFIFLWEKFTLHFHNNDFVLLAFLLVSCCTFLVSKFRKYYWVRAKTIVDKIYSRCRYITYVELPTFVPVLIRAGKTKQNPDEVQKNSNPYEWSEELWANSKIPPYREFVSILSCWYFARFLKRKKSSFFKIGVERCFGWFFSGQISRYNRNFRLQSSNILAYSTVNITWMRLKIDHASKLFIMRTFWMENRTNHPVNPQRERVWIENVHWWTCWQCILDAELAFVCRATAQQLDRTMYTQHTHIIVNFVFALVAIITITIRVRVNSFRVYAILIVFPCYFSYIFISYFCTFVSFRATPLFLSSATPLIVQYLYDVEIKLTWQSYAYSELSFFR